MSDTEIDSLYPSSAVTPVGALPCSICHQYWIEHLKGKRKSEPLVKEEDVRKPNACSKCHHYLKCHTLTNRHICNPRNHGQCTANIRSECPTNHYKHKTAEQMAKVESKTNLITSTRISQQLKGASDEERTAILQTQLEGLAKVNEENVQQKREMAMKRLFSDTNPKQEEQPNKKVKAETKPETKLEATIKEEVPRVEERPFLSRTALRTATSTIIESEIQYVEEHLTYLKQLLSRQTLIDLTDEATTDDILAMKEFLEQRQRTRKNIGPSSETQPLGPSMLM